MGIKRILSLFVALTLVLSAVFAAPIFANGAAVQDGPTLSEGNHALWIDRIADLPEYAEDFYEWLGNNASVGGCLVDPTKAMAVGEAYAYHAFSVTESVAYSCSDGQTYKQAAEEAAVNHAYPQFQTVMAYLSNVYSAFTRDMPEVFWLSGQSNYGWSLSYEYSFEGGKGQVTYCMNVYFYLQKGTFDIRAEEYRDVNVLTAAIAKCQQDIDAILSDCPKNASVYEKICYLNRVLTHTNSYNTSSGAVQSKDPWCCVSALDGRIGADGPVCEGYSKAFKVLCDRLGIGCVLVEGDARSSKYARPESHMWNYVCIGGQWYAMDVTWNDPLVVNQTVQAVSGHEIEKWLLLGSNTQIDEGMSYIESHPVTNVITSGGLDFSNGPVLSKEAYQPGTETSSDEEAFCYVSGSYVHDYESKVTYPTLTANGYTTLTCKGCGYSCVKNYTFPDVPPTLWSYNAIEFAVAKGFFSGYKSGNFGPTDNITRQDFVVVLARIAGADLSQYSGRTGYPDVAAGSYYEAAVKWASSNGVVMGYNNGKFGVGDKITREQLVTILYRYAQKIGCDTSVPSTAKNKLTAYTDAGKITPYAKEAVIWALHKGVISGMTATTVGPQNSASRGQVATILMNISTKGIMPI